MPLKVEIGADVSAFLAAMKDVGVSAKQVSNEVSKQLADAAMQTDKLGGAAQSASMKMMQMRSGISAARDGVMAFTLGGQAAERSLMAMGHHINSLVNETGSFRGAMGALGSSLLGPGGVILGITLAVELFSKWRDSQKKAAEATKEYVSTLDSLRQAQLKGEQDGRNEITRLQILYAATQNHALSMQKRNEAYDELEKKYPKWFTNAEREKTLLGDNKIKYDELTVAILAAANAKAYENQIGVNSNRAFENDQKVIDELKEQAKQQKIISEERRNRELSTSGREGTGGGQTVTESHAVDALAASIKRVNDLKTDSKKLNEQNLKLAQMASDFEAKAGFKTGPEESGKESKSKEAVTGLALLQKELKDAETALENSILAGKTKSDDATSPLVRRVNAATEAIRKFKAEMEQATEGIGAHNFTLQDSRNAVKPSTAGDAFGNGAADLTSMQKTIAAYKEYGDMLVSGRTKQIAFDKELKNDAKAGQEVARVFGDGLMNAFQQALSGTASFVSAMGQFLLQLIEKLIAAAAAAAVLAVLLKATGFGAALGGAGSFGSLFGSLSGLTALIPQHASGGIFTQAHVGMFGEAGPEAIVTPKHLQDFAGISGGNSGGSFTVEHKITGPDLQLWITRSGKQKSRRT